MNGVSLIAIDDWGWVCDLMSFSSSSSASCPSSDILSCLSRWPMTRVRSDVLSGGSTGEGLKGLEDKIID